ncbi:hypothetical protein FACS1894160_0950 [Bacteroidia bacterium]|nr:hypothetical protein FACS1894160_0950 [Bacteroidia bacterium]
MTCYLKVNCKLNKKLPNNGYLIGENYVLPQKFRVKEIDGKNGINTKALYLPFIS